jgi:hypothetical protein
MVLVVDGYGVGLRVERGHLVVTDGFAVIVSPGVVYDLVAAVR